MDRAAIRRAELAALAAIVASLPGSLSEEEITEALTVPVRTPQGEEEARRAIGGLVEVGLAERRGSLLVPTPATRRLAEMEVEL